MARKRHTRKVETEEADNPVIGYLLVDSQARVFDPTGRGIDPAYGSEAKARQAGGGQPGVRPVALYWGGVANVVWGDVGDIQLDGEAAQQLVRACQRQRVAYDRQQAATIRGDDATPRYSSRALLQAGRR